ncbi:MAG: helix-turn-helix domain-containing protein [Verrucomicrobia bacterium]|nr:helix-turn-helix domain-containing protein [Verrucomicrobiota bacterium]
MKKATDTKRLRSLPPDLRLLFSDLLWAFHYHSRFQRRLAVVTVVSRLMACRAFSQNQCARLLGVSAATLCRYGAAYRTEGEAGLLPKFPRRARRPLGASGLAGGFQVSPVTLKRFYPVAARGGGHSHKR